MYVLYVCIHRIGDDLILWSAFGRCSAAFAVVVAVAVAYLLIFFFGQRLKGQNDR